MQIDQDVDIHRTIYPYSRQGTLVPILTKGVGGGGKITSPSPYLKSDWKCVRSQNLAKR